MYKLNTFPNKPTIFNPYFDRHKYKQYKSAKVGTKSCRSVREDVSFLHAQMLLLSLHEQTQILPTLSCKLIITYA